MPTSARTVVANSTAAMLSTPTSANASSAPTDPPATSDAAARTMSEISADDARRRSFRREDDHSAIRTSAAFLFFALVGVPRVVPNAPRAETPSANANTRAPPPSPRSIVAVANLESRIDSDASIDRRGAWNASTATRCFVRSSAAANEATRVAASRARSRDASSRSAIFSARAATSARTRAREVGVRTCVRDIVARAAFEWSASGRTGPSTSPHRPSATTSSFSSSSSSSFASTRLRARNRPANASIRISNRRREGFVANGPNDATRVSTASSPSAATHAFDAAASASTTDTNRRVTSNAYVSSPSLTFRADAEASRGHPGVCDARSRRHGICDVTRPPRGDEFDGSDETTRCALDPMNANALTPTRRSLDPTADASGASTRLTRSENSSDDFARTHASTCGLSARSRAGDGDLAAANAAAT